MIPLFLHSEISIFKNVAIDEAMFKVTRKKNKPIMRIWEQKETAIVIGRSQKIDLETNLTNCLEDNIPIVRRCSAGGSVIQKIGSINFVFSFPTNYHLDLKDVKKSFKYFATIIIEALQLKNIPTQYRLLSDITTIDGAKISGNAQARTPNTVMHHGTLLVSSCQEEMTKYLAHPSTEPEYRKSRPHHQFVTSLEDRGHQLNSKQLANTLKEQLNEIEIKEYLPEEILQLADELVQNKYKKNLWNQTGKLK